MPEYLQAPKLEFHQLSQQRAAPENFARLLTEAKQLLQRDGMASMDEYGDMLKWGLPSRNGMCRYFHVFHPTFCSFSDQYKGTVHYHGGRIRGTVLIGEMKHSVYKATRDEGGDRILAGQKYSIEQRESIQPAGTQYSLPTMVPHWTKPTQLTMTYFEEEDNEVMGDLLEPLDAPHDEHVWTQKMANELLPQLIGAIDNQLHRLLVSA